MRNGDADMTGFGDVLIDQLSADRRRTIAAVRSNVKTLQWMVAINLVLTIAVVIKVFLGR